MAVPVLSLYSGHGFAPFSSDWWYGFPGVSKVVARDCVFVTFSFVGGLFAVTVIEAVFDVCVDGFGLWFGSMFDSFVCRGGCTRDFGL